jgi:prepilin peptidase CpaA
MPVRDFHSIMIWPVLTAVLVAALIDFRTNRIPNWLTVPFLVAGLLTSGISAGWSGLGHSILGVMTGAATLGLFCYLGGMGMGDLKLCAGLGAWLWSGQLLTALLFTGVAGGIIALCWALAAGFLRQMLRGTASLIARFATNGLRPHETIVLENPLCRRIPYAPAIAIGTIFALVGKH